MWAALTIFLFIQLLTPEVYGASVSWADQQLKKHTEHQQITGGTEYEDSCWQAQYPDLHNDGHGYPVSRLYKTVELLNRADETELIRRSEKLEQTIDHILGAYRAHRLPIRHAIERLLDPSLLSETGYLFDLHLSTEYNDSEIRGSTRSYPGSRAVTGSAARPSKSQTAGNFKSPGFVTIAIPVIKNGYDLFDLENALVAKDLLLTIAEELYHLVQHLRTGGAESRPISKCLIKNEVLYARLASEKVENGNTVFEADVYAKLLEVLGPAEVPEWYGKNYPVRQFIERKWFKLARSYMHLQAPFRSLACAEQVRRF